VSTTTLALGRGGSNPPVGGRNHGKEGAPPGCAAADALGAPGTGGSPASSQWMICTVDGSCGPGQRLSNVLQPPSNRKTADANGKIRTDIFIGKA